MTQHTKACETCPFNRATEPGYLGGSPPETYIGQIYLGFWLPCHMSGHYAGKESDVNEVQQCAGAAIFRANIGFKDVPRILFANESGAGELKHYDHTAALLRLPADKEAVFANAAEFYAFHRQIPIEAARAIVTMKFVGRAMQKEITDPDVRPMRKYR